MLCQRQSTRKHSCPNRPLAEFQTDFQSNLLWYEWAGLMRWGLGQTGIHLIHWSPFQTWNTQHCWLHLSVKVTAFGHSETDDFHVHVLRGFVQTWREGQNSREFKKSEEEECFMFSHQVESMMEFKTDFAVEALINDHSERKGPTFLTVALLIHFHVTLII